MGNELDANIVIRFFSRESLVGWFMIRRNIVRIYSFYEIQFFEEFFFIY